jgi:hypothetical protein
VSRPRAIAAVAAMILSASPRATSAAPARAPETFGPAEPGGDAPTPDDPPGDPPGEPPGEEAAPSPDDPSGDEAEDPNDDALDDDTTETAPDPPRSKRFVWGGTEIEARADDDEPEAKGPARPASPDTDGSVPGGYLGPTDTKEVAPKDGERKLLVAYIVLPLGTLAMVSGAVATWFTHPDHCQERLGRVGNDINPKQCRGLWILNIVRTTYGSMMIASGAVLLGLGLREKKRYREWKRKHGAFVQPWFQRGQGGFVLGGRF